MRISVSLALEIVSLVTMHSHAMNAKREEICITLKTQMRTYVLATRTLVGNKYQINFSHVLALKGS